MVYGGSRTPEEFLTGFHAFSKYWANDNHIVSHPHINEDQFINQILNENNI